MASGLMVWRFDAVPPRACSIGHQIDDCPAPKQVLPLELSQSSQVNRGYFSKNSFQYYLVKSSNHNPPARPYRDNHYRIIQKIVENQKEQTSSKLSVVQLANEPLSFTVPALSAGLTNHVAPAVAIDAVCVGIGF